MAELLAVHLKKCGYEVAGRSNNGKETIARLAFMDTLTGLPNRNLFYDRLQQAIGHVKRR